MTFQFIFILVVVSILLATDFFITIIKDDEPASIALVDKATYILASGLQEIAGKNPKLSDNIISVLWSFAKRIIELVNEEDGNV